MHQMKCADGDVRGHPQERKPARPIPPAEHERSGNDGPRSKRGDPYNFVHHGPLRPEVRVVRSGREHADCDIQPCENRDRDWTFFGFLSGH